MQLLLLSYENHARDERAGVSAADTRYSLLTLAGQDVNDMTVSGRPRCFERGRPRAVRDRWVRPARAQQLDDIRVTVDGSQVEGACAVRVSNIQVSVFIGSCEKYLPISNAFI